MDGGSKLLACGLDRYSVLTIRINLNSSVRHIESFTPYPFHCYLSATYSVTPAQILPFICAKWTMPWPHLTVFLLPGLCSGCSLYLTSLPSPPSLSTWQAPTYICHMSFSGGTMVKNPPTNAENARNQGSIRGSRRSPEGRNSNPLQDPCLENRWTSVPGGLHTVRGVAKNQIRLSIHACVHTRAHTHTQSLSYHAI